MPKDAGGAAAAKAEKAVTEAEKGLIRLQSELLKLMTLLKQDKFSEKRAKAINTKILGMMAKHKGVTKLPGDKGFDELPDELREKVMWLDTLMNDLMGYTSQLPRMIKFMKKSAEKDFKFLSKQAKILALEVKQAPKHLNVLVKDIKKGVEPGGETAEKMNMMPMILLLWQLNDTIGKGMREKP